MTKLFIKGENGRLYNDMCEYNDKDIKLIYGSNVYGYHSFILKAHSPTFRGFLSNGEREITIDEKYECPVLMDWLYGKDISYDEVSDVDKLIKMYNCIEYYQIVGFENAIKNMIHDNLDQMYVLMKRRVHCKLIELYGEEINSDLFCGVSYDYYTDFIKTLNLQHLSTEEYMELLNSMKYRPAQLLLTHVWFAETNNDQSRYLLEKFKFDKGDLRQYYDVIIAPWKDQFSSEYKLSILESPLVVLNLEDEIKRRKRTTTTRPQPEPDDETLRKHIKFEKYIEINNSVNSVIKRSCKKPKQHFDYSPLFQKDDISSNDHSLQN